MDTYSKVARARDVRKILQEKKEEEALKMLEVLRDDDFVPLNDDELKLVLRCGVQFWTTYSSGFEHPEEALEAIKKASLKVLKSKK